MVSHRAAPWCGRTACSETSRQACSRNGGCSISVVAGRCVAHPCAARTRCRASRTGSTLARRFRRKTVSVTTDAKLPPSACEDAEQCAIDRVGLQARVRCRSGRLAVKEQFPGRRTCNSTYDDRAAVRLDRLGNGMGRHFDPVNGDGSWLHAGTVPGVNSACCEPVPPDVRTSGGLDQSLVNRFRASCSRRWATPQAPARSPGSLKDQARLRRRT